VGNEPRTSRLLPNSGLQRRQAGGRNCVRIDLLHRDADQGLCAFLPSLCWLMRCFERRAVELRLQLSLRTDNYRIPDCCHVLSPGPYPDTVNSHC
jgi:hypothetical protein